MDVSTWKWMFCSGCLIISACSKGPDYLVPKTQHGANTFGFIVEDHGAYGYVSREIISDKLDENDTVHLDSLDNLVLNFHYSFTKQMGLSGLLVQADVYFLLAFNDSLNVFVLDSASYNGGFIHPDMPQQFDVTYHQPTYRILSAEFDLYFTDDTSASSSGHYARLENGRFDIRY